MSLEPAEKLLFIEIAKALAVEIRRFGYGAISRSSWISFSPQDIEDIQTPQNRKEALPVRGASFDHGYQSTYERVCDLMLQFGICEAVELRAGVQEFFRFSLDYAELDAFFQQRYPWESVSLSHLAGSFFQCHGNGNLIERHGFMPTEEQKPLAESFCVAGYAKRRTRGFEWLADEIDVQFEDGNPVWLGLRR
jgi:hypothetical protein